MAWKTIPKGLFEKQLPATGVALSKAWVAYACCLGKWAACCVVRCNPSALMTFRMVSKRGIEPAAKVL